MELENRIQEKWYLYKSLYLFHYYYKFKKTLFVIITDYIFNNLFILAQACVNDWTLRDKITKKINHKALKSFALKETDIISMELKKHDD